MVIGVATLCRKCGEAFRSCVVGGLCPSCKMGPLPERVGKLISDTEKAMTASDYQREAGRTECDQNSARQRIAGNMYAGDVTPTRLLHAVIGAMGELGEIAQILEKWIYYGKGFDGAAIREEIGDALWYIALACTALGLDMGTLMRENLAKLRSRYPEAYNDELADRANRDRVKERAAMIMAGSFPDPAKQPSTGLVSRKTRSQVLAERENAVGGGCCDKFSNQMPCDCLEKAIDDLPKWNDPNTPPGDRSGS